MSQSANPPKRRELHFQTLDDIVRDIQALAGTQPTSTGKWSPGQIVEHVAKGIDLSVDGFDFKAPLPLRLFVRLARNHYLAKGFPAGIKPRGRMKDIFEPAPDADFATASRHLADAVERAKHQGMSAASPLFGRLTHDQWTQLNCRHAELHFSFLKPE
jgi:hypothetical protein